MPVLKQKNLTRLLHEQYALAEVIGRNNSSGMTPRILETTMKKNIAAICDALGIKNPSLSPKDQHRL